MSGIRPPDCSKLAKNPKNDNDVTIFRHDVNVKFFWRCFVSLVKFSYWSKFHVNIITGSGVMTISFYKGLIRNLEIGNALVWVLANIWKLGQVKNTTFRTNVPNKMLLNAAKCQGYNFYCSWVIRGRPTGSGITLPHHHPPRLGLITSALMMLILIKMILKPLVMSDLWLGVIELNNVRYLKRFKQRINACSMAS